MLIYLYNFAKKRNSTAIPVGTSASRKELSCRLKEESSLINPYLELTTDTNLYNYNYVYIPKFSRFYFINDIVSDGKLWLVSCRIDSLASFSSDIKASRQYVVRSASAYDTTIIDTQYPAKVDTTATTGTLSGNVETEAYGETGIVINNYFNRNIENGFFIIGVLGSNTGGISYYSLTYANFKTLINNLMAFTPTDMGDLSSGVAKRVANPLQFVVSCRWFPYSPGGKSQTSITFGNYTINVNCSLMFRQDYVLTFRQKMNIPFHPQATDRGLYLNSPTYAKYMLDFQPFGYINISDNQMIENSVIVLEWKVDYTTGDGLLHVRYQNESSTLGVYPATYGIPINLAQATVDIMGGLTSVGSAFANGVGALAGFTTGSPAGVARGFGHLAGAISNIGNAVNSFSPNATTKGTVGSFIQQKPPVLYAIFTRIPDEARSLFGRPLCEYRTLGTLSGYTVISNPAIELPRATIQEQNEVLSHMEQGFFLE